MIEDWIVTICGVIVIVAAIAVAVLKLRSAERKMHESAHKFRVYSDLLNAITELNLAGGDPYKMDVAKKNLALTLNRLNLVGSTGVLRSTNDLLDFLNEYKDKDYDTLRLHNILNRLVIEARRDINPEHAKKIEESQVRFRFFAPQEQGAAATAGEDGVGRSLLSMLTDLSNFEDLLRKSSRLPGSDEPVRDTNSFSPAL